MSVQEQVQETCEACGCVAEIGSIINEGDDTIQLSIEAETEAAALARLEQFSALAHEIYSDVSVSHETKEVAGGVLMTSTLVFSCTAEKIIFEMRARAI